MEFNIELPINHLSLGQVSFGILVELFNRKDSVQPNIFVTGNPDFSAFDIPNQEEFLGWFNERANNAIKRVGHKLPYLKYWHINGAERQIPNSKSVLWTVHELDAITETERDICNLYNKTCVTSNYSQQVFSDGGVKTKVIPNYFDAIHFKKIETRKQEGIINFCIIGKLEKRKNTHQSIAEWVKRWGGNPAFRLNSLIFNHFLPAEINKRSIDNLFRGSPPFNFNQLDFQPKNSSVNELLNFCDILIDGSGGEGFSLPTFNAIALGKQVVCMNAHAIPTYANKDNAILFEPNGKTEAWDGTFFCKGLPFNQGNIYTFNPEDFGNAMQEAVDRIQKGIENTEGYKLQEEFSVVKTVESLLSCI